MVCGTKLRLFTLTYSLQNDSLKHHRFSTDDESRKIKYLVAAGSVVGHKKSQENSSSSSSCVACTTRGA